MTRDDLIWQIDKMSEVLKELVQMKGKSYDNTGDVYDRVNQLIDEAGRIISSELSAKTEE